MPATNRRNKGAYGRYTQDALQQALDAITIKRLSFRAAAKQFGVPCTTLKDYSSGKSKVGSKAGRKRGIPAEIEDDIVKKVLKAANAGFPLTKKQFLEELSLLIQKHKLKTQFKNNIPSESYWRDLLRRHPELQLKRLLTPDTCRTNKMRVRNTMLTPDTCRTNKMQVRNIMLINSYFDELEDLMTKHDFLSNPHLVWSADNICLDLSTATDEEVAVQQEIKQGLAGALEPRNSVTTVVCIGGDGTAMPPLFAVSGDTLKSEQLFAADSLEGSVWMFKPNACTDSAIGVEWFQNIFLQNCGLARPQLLILNSHRSLEVVELLELAQQEGIHVLAVPPQTSHHLQPLDRAVFGPFKEVYKRMCVDYVSAHPKNIINKVSWPRIIAHVWAEVMTPDLLMMAFETTGILPVDRTKSPPAEYFPVYFVSESQPPASDNLSLSNATEATGEQSFQKRNKRKSKKKEVQKKDMSEDIKAVLIPHLP